MLISRFSDKDEALVIIISAWLRTHNLRSQILRAGKKYNFLTSGSSHTLALGQSGTVYVWGSNKEGQLGKIDKISLNRLISCQTANFEEKLVSNESKKKRQMVPISWHLVLWYTLWFGKKNLLTTLFHQFPIPNPDFFKFQFQPIFVCVLAIQCWEFVEACGEKLSHYSNFWNFIKKRS